MILSRSQQLLTILFLISYLISGSGYSPPPTSGEAEKAKASSSRGCPVPQGDLSLLVSSENSIETYYPRPNLLFEYNTGDREETFLFVIRDAELKPVYSQTIEIQGEGTLLIKVQADLFPNTLYKIVAGLLCQESVINAKALEVKLNRTNQITQLDQIVNQYLSKNND
uniref:Uncharacterized protein n=2 Tax=Gloeothece TaxID=28070 RepID=E0UN64_GLOV7|nr:hypothetical protein Cyan7822_6713 [Gloeothece verrucosa PCC 7822]